MFAIRYVLSAENKRRDAEPFDDTYDEVYIEKAIGEDGEMVKVKVDKVCPSFMCLKCSEELTIVLPTGIPGSDGYSEQRFPICFVNSNLEFFCTYNLCYPWIHE